MQLLLDWILKNYVELLGFISGIAYIFLSIKQKVAMWPLGVIMSLFYIWIFYVEKFYADSALQVYYVVISFYGWFLWANGNKTEDKLSVTSASLKVILILVTSTILLWATIGYGLSKTDSTLPYWDAFTTSTAIVATWMLSRKLIEHWVFWIVINPVATGLYIYKGMYITAILYAVLTILAVAGYKKWKASMQLEKI